MKFAVQVAFLPLSCLLAACASTATGVAAVTAADPHIVAAVSDTGRPQADKDRDADRKPAEMLAFAELRPGEKVAELLPGGGYFTRIFAKAVGPTGKVYAIESPPPPDRPERRSRMGPITEAYSNVVVLTQAVDKFTTPEPVALVWTSQNYHDLHLNPSADVVAINKQVFAALKPGGFYVVLDHSAVANSDLSVPRQLHRISQDIVRNEVEAAGFVFVGENNALRNPDDPRTAGVRDAAIRGKTDQFILKFRKPVSASASDSCNQACLGKVMDGFKASLLAKTPITLASNAEVRENMLDAKVEDSAWKDVKSIRSSMSFADPVTGNIVSRNGVELLDGKPGYLSIRLKVAGGKITEVEFSSDVARANASYVWSLPPMFSAEIPKKDRMTRADMDALAHRYFQTLTDHKAVVADFDDARCNRYHSGNQITNVRNDSVEAQGARTCVSSVDGPKPWGPALEQRFPVIDPEHGIVLGQTLLMYANQVMYVSEVFKIEKGRITNIDNIGIVKPGLDHTTGFGTRK